MNAEHISTIMARELNAIRLRMIRAGLSDEDARREAIGQVDPPRPKRALSLPLTAREEAFNREPRWVQEAKAIEAANQRTALKEMPRNEKAEIGVIRTSERNMK